MASPLLFSPLSLRGLTVRNRAWLAPMCQYSVERCDGVPTDWHLVHLGSHAIGGFGLLLTEATAVAPEGRISPQDTGLWNDEQAAAWRRITDFVHDRGAAIAAQLAHAGRKASTHAPFARVLDEECANVSPADGGWAPVAPSSLPFPGYRTPHELSRGEIAEVVAAFGEAAQRADDAGFDAVEVHAAHGYLLHEFCSPLSNRRTDSYGGSFANRTRIVLEVIEAVRAAWPAEKPVLVRISATDWSPEGWGGEDSVRLARLLSRCGVDLVDVSSGGNVPAQIPIGPGYQLPFARALRHEAGIMTGAVGLITEPVQAEQVLRDGGADAILIGRAALREPGWPQRAAHQLRATDAVVYPPQYERGAW